MVPMPIKATPYAHQREAYEFACKKFGLIPTENTSNGLALLMEMGTGKTLTSIAISTIFFKLRKVRRVLVIAPLSILPVWKEEFKKFADTLHTVTVLKGSSREKVAMLKNVSNVWLQVVVNYESTWRIEKELLEFDADLVIADEAHKIKNARTAQSKALHHFGDKARHKLLLTGTPVPNKEMDVFSQYRFLNKSVFGENFYAFRNRYFDMVGYGNHTPKFKAHMRDEFLEKMHSIAFRVTKDECLDLPDITEEVRMVELESKAIKLYKNLEKESYIELANSEVSAVNVLTKLLRLSQLTGGYLTDDDGNITSVSTAKLNALSDIIDSAMEENKKLVIMARFVNALDERIKSFYTQTALTRLRNAVGLSQSELAERSGVSIRIIQAYEQRMRDINKAQLATIANLAQALDCDAIDLLEK